MKNREECEPTLITMTDALSRNTVYATETVVAYCNVHARREFVDLIEVFPDPVEQILETYEGIWNNERKAESFDPVKRLAHHQEHSLPLMKQIQARCQSDLDSEEVEANSNLGQAMPTFRRLMRMKYAG